MINTINFTKGQKFKLLFQKPTYNIIKVSGKCIFTEDNDGNITSFYYDYLLKKVRFIKN